MNNQYIKNIQKTIIKDNFDGLVISSGSDIKYLTNFTGEYGTSVLLITKSTNFFITDSRFVNQAKQELDNFEIITVRSGSSYYKCTGEIINKNNLKNCGYYGSDLSYRDFLSMNAECTNTIFSEAPSYIAELRSIKSIAELDKIREACRISMLSFYSTLDLIKPGVSEIEIANELEYQFHKHGGEGYCFDTIVASGPKNGANCHATPSSRKVALGDFITIDFGTYYNGYCSDITRTISLGKQKNLELLKIFKIVSEAKKKGQDSLKPGLKLCELNQIINNIVDKNGYSIPHGPGHSFGLTIHEHPFISPSSDYILKPGVVHTIEPGIYIDGIGGVRQEDDYLITENGYERLTYITDELIVL